MIRTFARGALALVAARAVAQGSIAGTVYDSLRTHAPLANATVVLVERARYATTDAHGRFRIDSVPDGHYTVGLMHAILDSLDMELPAVPVEVSAGHGARVTLSTPSAATAYARLCPGAHEADSGVIIGRVRDVDDASPLSGATVSTDWTEYTLTAGRAASHRVGAAVQTNEQGVYLLCGVPTTVPLALQTERAGFLVGPTPFTMDERLIERVDFAVSRRDSAALTVRLRDSSAVASHSSGSATLTGVVLGGDGRPVRDATVAVVGTSRSARSDTAGVFRLDHIPAGTRTIEVRAIGLLPTAVSVDFATNVSRNTTLSVSRQAQALKPVTVKERATTASLMLNDGFETRRKQGLGAFVTEEDIARHSFSDLISVLQGLRGVNVEWGGSGKTAGISFPMPYLLGISSPQGGLRCLPNFFLDGAPFPVARKEDYRDLSAMLPPLWIKGIEVYSSPGTIPAQYDLTSSTGCGSIVIWTR
jgi:hypothetical protein